MKLNDIQWNNKKNIKWNEIWILSIRFQEGSLNTGFPPRPFYILNQSKKKVSGSQKNSCSLLDTNCPPPPKKN